MAKEISPIYLSVARLDQVIDLVSKRSLAEISAGFFVSHKFNQSDASLAVSTLKFLGIADENGRVHQEIIRKFQLKGGEGKKGVEEVVRKAYDKLFQKIGEPQNLDTEELSNDFVETYNLSPRLAKPATLAFLKMCEYAGLKEEGSIVGRVRTAKNSTRDEKRNNKFIAQSNSQQNSFKNEKNTLVPFAEGNIELSLPTELLTKAIFGGELGVDLKLVMEALSKFADKYTSKKTPNESTD